MNWSWFAWKDDVIAIQSSRKARANLGTTDLRTKTSRGRLTRLMHEFADIMRADLKPGEEPPKTGPVFPEYAAMDNKSKSRRFDAYLTHCGVPVEDNGHSRTPHSCRHTWTCLMLASGENEMLVKQYAGHSEKEMTEHYAEQQERFRKRVRAEEWEPGELRLQPPSDGVDEPSPAETSNVIAGPWRRSTAN